MNACHVSFGGGPVMTEHYRNTCGRCGGDRRQPVLDRLDGVSSDRVVGWLAGRDPGFLNEVLDEMEAFDARHIADPERWP